jgi:hypothetical protein
VSIYYSKQPYINIVTITHVLYVCHMNKDI